MKPLMLHGHERSITQIKYNLEGDLLFSCSKDTEPNVWYSLNGERLGTFKGHGGAVWCIDVNWESTVVMTGSADNTCRLWDCETGVEKHKLEEETAVRTCGFSYSGNLIMYTTDKTMGRDCLLNLYDVRDENQIKNKQPMKSVPIQPYKVTAAIWGELDDTLITGHDNGDIMKWDIKKYEVLSKAPEKHSKQINDLQRNKDSSMFITASKDTTAKLYDMESLGVMKMYKTERPVNSAAISPIRPHVVAGGGQEAMEVTTSSVRQGKFDARFYHLVFEDEFARVKGHFGPINSVAFHPDGKSYSSGGEDGYIRIHNFDQSYFDFDFEY